MDHTGACLDAGTEANYYGFDPHPGCQPGAWVGWAVPVGSHPANTWGLYDMHRNLWEWCNDWFAVHGGDDTNPVGPLTGSARVARGGGWALGASYCRSADRLGGGPTGSDVFIGFRPARTAS